MFKNVLIIKTKVFQLNKSNILPSTFVLLTKRNCSSTILPDPLRYTENKYSYTILKSIPKYKNNLSTTISNQFEQNNINLIEFNRILDKCYRTESATEIVKTFKKLQHTAKTNNISLSDQRFDKLVDGLMDQCENLTDQELSELLACIRCYPAPESLSAHNFHDIWSALDDMCLARLSKWSESELLLFLDHFYLLNLSKYVDYFPEALNLLNRRVKRLTSAELVQTLFYVNVKRKKWSMFDFEQKLQTCVNELSTNELSIVGLSFFKTETSIKETDILLCMLNRLLEETKTVNEITLAAILKIVRYSRHLGCVDKIIELLTKLVPEIDRLSILCCVHIALLGTVTHIFHSEILTAITRKFVQNINATRIKDLERLTFALTLFNFEPNVEPNFFDLVLKELQDPKRRDEIEKYPRCLSCCVHYLGLKQIYSYDLVNKILDSKFMDNAYGTNKMSIGREILVLDKSIEIDCPDYRGNRLQPKLQFNLTKWNIGWIPRRDQKQSLTATDKLMLDIIDTIEEVCGMKPYIDYILPHFERADIIVCKNQNGDTIDVQQHYQQYTLGNVMRPGIGDDYIWYAIVVGGWNTNIRDTMEPIGSLSTKLRHLKKIGYVPVWIPWSVFTPMSQHERKNYIKRKLR